MDQQSYTNHYTLKHSLYLLTTVMFLFIWAISPYRMFATQIASSLLAVYLIKHMLKEHISIRTEVIIDSIVLTGIILVIVSSTGSLSSPVFFLIYFLLFALSLMTTPSVPLVLSFSLIIYFIFSDPIVSLSQLLPLASFPLITPLSVYFGRQHNKNLYQRQDIYHLKETVRRETEDVLLWLTTLYSEELAAMKNKIDRFPSQDDKQRYHLRELTDSVEKLKKIGEKLKAAIEED